MEENNVPLPPPLQPNKLSVTKVNISTEKLFGGIGLIFIFLSMIPFIGLLFWLIGYTLLTVGMYQLSKKLNNPAIFNNFLIAVVLSITSWIIAFMFGIISSISIASLSHMNSGIDVGMAIILITLYFVFLVVAYFYNKAYTLLALSTKHNLFRIASITMFIGVVTTIILIGFIVMFVGLLLLVIAFFTAPDEIEVVT